MIKLATLIKPIFYTMLFILINKLIFPYEKIILSLFYDSPHTPYSKADNEKKFEYIKDLGNGEGTKENFNKIINSIKSGNIIDNDHIDILFNGNYMKEDSIVLMRTNLIIPALKSTTFLRVSTLYETDVYFELCLSASEENVIDGYYKYKIRYNDNDGGRSTIKIHIIWVLSNPPKLLKFIHKTWEDPNETIKKTGDNIIATIQ